MTKDELTALAARVAGLKRSMDEAAIMAYDNETDARIRKFWNAHKAYHEAHGEWLNAVGVSQ